MGKPLPWRNNYFSLLARGLETVHALELAADLLASYVPPVRSRVPIVPRAGIGGHGTEAPRGICWHEYRTEADGTIVSARIIPPTSQNYAMIEADLRALAPQVAELPDEDAGLALRAPDPQLRPVHQLLGAFSPLLADARRRLRSAKLSVGAAATPSCGSFFFCSRPRKLQEDQAQRSATMYDERKLSDGEWELIVELLERELERTARRNPSYPQFERSGGTARTRKWCGVCSLDCGRRRLSRYKETMQAAGGEGGDRMVFTSVPRRLPRDKPPRAAAPPPARCGEPAFDGG